MTSKSRSFGRYLGYFIGSLLSLIVVVALVLSLVRIPLDLSNYKSIFESSASSALGRKVRIDGNITVTTSLWPYFEIQGLRIVNDDPFGDGDLANMEVARITVGLLPLLRKKIHIRQFRIESLTLNLVRDETGAVNWEFDQSAGTDAPPPSDTEIVTTQIEMANDGLAVDELVLGDISVSFLDQSSGETFGIDLQDVTGTAPFGDPMALSMTGRLLEEPFALDVEANSLGEFLAMTRSRLELTANLAQTNFHFAGQSDVLSGGRTLEFDVSVDGDRFDSLGDFLKLDLPPLENYSVGASFRVSPGRLEMTDVIAVVKESSINGSVAIDKTGTKPVAELKLASEAIQLADFNLGGWSPDDTGVSKNDSADVDSTAGNESTVDAAPARAKLLSPETLQRANVSIDVEIGKVMSGEDELGGGEISLQLLDGRLALDVLRLSTPRASLLLAASVKPDVVESEASLRVVIENFDLGVLARLSKPDSDVSGPLNMDMDVTMSAKSVRDLLSGANGYIDVAGSPENVSSGIVDLWAVNLLASVVSSAVEDENTSEINCVISRWSIEDGLMTAQQLAVDTSKIRICGDGNINFKEKSFALEVFPTAKKPEFFSLAAPLVVSGNFDDIDVGAKGGIVAVGTTAVRFAVSPLTTPIKRAVQENLPVDGADICGLPIGPRDGELEALPGC